MEQDYKDKIPSGIHSVPDGLPLVTVITPAYNRADYLNETVESVLSQDYPNLEYIVLDDGSTDNTRELLEAYGGRIRWESHENMGETRTVNKGFSMASGEIIGVVNSDDPLLPGAIRALVSALVSDPSLLVAYPDWDYIDKDGSLIDHVKTMDYDYIQMLRNFQCVPGPGAFFRRKVVEFIGGRDPRYRLVADFDFWLRAGLHGPFARVPLRLATFRTHPGSASVNQKGTQMADEHLDLVKRIYAMPEMPQEGLRFKVRHEAYSSAYFIAGVVCGEDSRWMKVKFFLLSFAYSPWTYFGRNSWKFDLMMPSLLGRYYKVFRPFFRTAYRFVKAVKLSARRLKH